MFIEWKSCKLVWVDLFLLKTLFIVFYYCYIVFIVERSMTTKVMELFSLMNYLCPCHKKDIYQYRLLNSKIIIKPSFCIIFILTGVWNRTDAVSV